MGGEVKPSRRRTARLARCMAVVLRWHDAKGNPFEEPAETTLLSRYGGLLVCKTPIYLAGDFSLSWLERQKNAAVRIVFRELSGPEHLVKVGFEFLHEPDFWEMEFPPDHMPW